ncbi:MAG: hypothetical protein PHC34_01885 [Candidatus Gastranaerophilales bacterium]|nr:hypothetical protein [Candidatus Gastranaerophilales bacterium]
MKVCNSVPIYNFTDNSRIYGLKTRPAKDKLQFHGIINSGQKCFFSKSNSILDLFKNIAGSIRKLTENINKSRLTPVLDLDKMLNPDNLYMIMNSKIRGKKDFIFQINGKKIYPKFLNSGGTKAVYQVKINDTPYAIAICSRANYPELQAQKWRNALNEPKNTEILRNLGLRVNDISEIYPIKINGYNFPAIRMKPYSSHSFQIFDVKERSHNINPVIDAKDHVDNEKCAGFFSQISKEIAILLANNISLKSDSINLCFDKGNLHLFFNDLDMKNLINPDISKNSAKYAEYYSQNAVLAFLKNFNDKSFQTNEYIKNLNRSTKTYKEFVETITRKSLSELEALKTGSAKLL